MGPDPIFPIICHHRVVIAFLHPWGDVAVGVILIGFVSATFFSAQRLKEKAGQPLLMWRLKGEGKTRFMGVFAAYFLMGTALLLVPAMFLLTSKFHTLAARSPSCPNPVPPIPDFRAAPFVVFVAALGILVLLQVKVGLFEHGVLVNPFRFVPWSMIRRFEIARHPLGLGRDMIRFLVVNSYGNEKRLWMPLPSIDPKSKEEILRILGERVPR